MTVFARFMRSQYELENLHCEKCGFDMMTNLDIFENNALLEKLCCPVCGETLRDKKKDQ